MNHEPTVSIYVHWSNSLYTNLGKNRFCFRRDTTKTIVVCLTLLEQQPKKNKYIIIWGNNNSYSIVNQQKDFIAESEELYFVQCSSYNCFKYTGKHTPIYIVYGQSVVEIENKRLCAAHLMLEFFNQHYTIVNRSHRLGFYSLIYTNHLSAKKYAFGAFFFVCSSVLRFSTAFVLFASFSEA